MRVLKGDNDYTVTIRDDLCTGYFERDGQAIGGLWFEGKGLVDYDGTFSLPKSVASALRADGFIVGPEFD